MPTIKEETLDTLRRVYRMHDYEPGFQLSESTTYTEKADAVAVIIRASRSLQRTAESRCNGIERYDAKAALRLASWTDDDEAKAERDDKRNLARVSDALAMIYGDTWADRIDLEVQGDPRGAMVQLYAKGFGGRGSCRIAF